MRIMVLVKATPDSEAGKLPTTEVMEAFARYNEELVSAGVLVSGEGLLPSSEGKRVIFDGVARSVVDGPFDQTRELVSGFWILNVNDMSEAVDWIKRSPNPMPGRSEIEIRRIAEATDFGDAMTPELADREKRLRNKLNET